MYIRNATPLVSIFRFFNFLLSLDELLFQLQRILKCIIYRATLMDGWFVKLHKMLVIQSSASIVLISSISLLFYLDVNLKIPVSYSLFLSYHDCIILSLSLF